MKKWSRSGVRLEVFARNLAQLQPKRLPNHMRSPHHSCSHSSVHQNSREDVFHTASDEDLFEEWVSKWVSSFLTAYQHNIGYAVPYY